MALSILFIGAAIGTYIIGGVALTGAAVAAKYGWKWWDDYRHEEGLVKAFKAHGPEGFRCYAYKHLDISSKDEMDMLCAVKVPDIAGQVAKELASKKLAQKRAEAAAKAVAAI